MMDSDREPHQVGDQVTDDVGEIGMWFFRSWGVISRGDTANRHNLEDEVFERLPNAITYEGEDHLKFYRTKEAAMTALATALATPSPA
jgi:hypothetical protein